MYISDLSAGNIACACADALSNHDRAAGSRRQTWFRGDGSPLTGHVAQGLPDGHHHPPPEIPSGSGLQGVPRSFGLSTFCLFSPTGSALINKLLGSLIRAGVGSSQFPNQPLRREGFSKKTGSQVRPGGWEGFKGWTIKAGKRVHRLGH